MGLARAPGRLSAAVAVFWVLCATSAAAHLMPQERGTVNIVGNTAYSVVSVPVQAISFADDNKDGQIDTLELQRHNAGLQSAFAQGYSLSEDGNIGTVDLVYVLLPSEAEIDGDRSRYLVFMHQQHFDRPPVRLKLTSTLFSDEGSITLTATRGNEVSMVALSAARPHTLLFPAWQDTAAEFLGLGVMHILSGIDHLLFILTIIAAGTGLRYWLSVLTVFTVAHTITLSLTAFGLVSIDPAIVEPVIAGSIVILAVHALYARGNRPLLTVALVFVCGLVHGLGFGSEILRLQLTGMHRLVTLAAFNTGIELGQIAFISAVLTVAGLAARFLPTRITLLWPRAVAAFAGLAGCLFLVQRVVGVVG